jgi:hypothetical protein
MGDTENFLRWCISSLEKIIESTKSELTEDQLRRYRFLCEECKKALGSSDEELLWEIAFHFAELVIVINDRSGTGPKGEN